MAFNARRSPAPVCELGPILDIVPFLLLCVLALIVAIATYRLSPDKPLQLSGPLNVPGLHGLRMNATGAVAAFLITLVLLRALAPETAFSYQEWCNQELGIHEWRIDVPVSVLDPNAAPVAGYSLNDSTTVVTMTPRKREFLPDGTLRIRYPLTDEQIRSRNLPKIHVGLTGVPHYADTLDLSEINIVEPDLRTHSIQVHDVILLQMQPPDADDAPEYAPAPEDVPTEADVSSEFEDLPPFKPPEQ